MKDHLRSFVTSASGTWLGRNLTREYLQARILSSLQRSGAMIPLAFHGGTALRFLYGIERYSEDLDFALEQRPEHYDLRRFLTAVKADLVAETYAVELRLREDRVVHSAFVRFPGLLHELGLSPHATQVLSIKLEVDTRPPVGARLETTLLRRFVTLRLQHHDRASLLAGKLHAVLQRRFQKGRDIFDLSWYLTATDWPEPNLVMLNAALEQSGWSGTHLTRENWALAVRERLEALDWDRIEADLRPFLSAQALAEMPNRAELTDLLRARGGR